MTLAQWLLVQGVLIEASGAKGFNFKMENFSIGIGVIGLLIGFAVIAFRFRCYKTNVDHRLWLFMTYVGLSGLLGAGLIAVGFIDIPSPYDICFALIMFSWNVVSVLATFTTPPRWCAFPISYIVLCSLLCIYSVTAAEETPEPSRPFVSIILFGAILLIEALVMLIITSLRPKAASPDSA